MKATVIVSIILASVAGPSYATDVSLSIQSSEGFPFSCTITNGTERRLYVYPRYQLEQYYAQPNCSGCATGWVASYGLQPIGDAKDYIPLDSGACFAFRTHGIPINPWRMTCMAVTNSAHIGDRALPDENTRIVVRSLEVPGVKLVAPTHTTNALVPRAHSDHTPEKPLKTKSEEMREGLAKLNDDDVVLYGRVIDQFGSPVANAVVSGIIQVNNGIRVGTDRMSTTTDSSGLFAISGYTGKNLGVNITKAGYVLATTGTSFVYERVGPIIFA